jgi:cytochrome c oxidase assembly factor CtaG
MVGSNLNTSTFQSTRPAGRFLRIMLVGLIVDFSLLADPIDSIANTNLTVHMFQHIGLFVASIVFGYSLDRYLACNLDVLKEKFHFGWSFLIKMIKFNVRTKGLILGAVLPAIVFSYWHFPPTFDLAETNLTVHILEHLSYIIIGSIVGMSIMAMTSKIRIGLLYFAFMQAGMMGSMMLIWPSFYPVYSAAQNLNMDTSMMLFGALGLIAVSSTLLKYLDII